MRLPNAEMSPTSFGDRLIKFGLSTPPYLMIPFALLATEVLPLTLDYIADLFFPNRQIGGPNLGSHGIVSALIELPLKFRLPAGRV